MPIYLYNWFLVYTTKFLSVSDFYRQSVYLINVSLCMLITWVICWLINPFHRLINLPTCRVLRCYQCKWHWSCQSVILYSGVYRFFAFRDGRFYRSWSDNVENYSSWSAPISWSVKSCTNKLSANLSKITGKTWGFTVLAIFSSEF